VTRLYWVNGPWKGRLALAARPRGGDWLEDEIAEWKRAGIGAVLSLLTAEEENEFNLRREGEHTRKQGLEFSSFPIADMQVPRSEAKLAQIVERVAAMLSSGKTSLFIAVRASGVRG
jgi:hypothetical protein